MARHTVNRSLQVKCVIMALFWNLTAMSAPKEFNLIAEDDWLPYSGLQDGKILGIGPDVIQAAYEAMGAKVSFKSAPFSRCLKQVESGQDLGCFNTLKQSDTEKRFLFHKRPLYENKTGIFSLEKSKDPFELKHLIGKSVGYTRGYHYGDFLDSSPGIKRVTAPSDTSNLKMLMARRVQYSLVGTLNAGYIFKTQSQSFPTKPFLIATNESQELYVSFSLKHPQSQEAAELLDDGLKKIRDNGVYAAIMQKWLKLYPFETPNHTGG